MRSTNAVSVTGADASAGARWVDRYLVPRVAEMMGGRGLDGLRILQLEPEGVDEALRCQALGAHVAFASLQSPGALPPAVVHIPIRADATICAGDRSFDVLVSGQLGRIVCALPSAPGFLAECARVCAPGGGLLAVLATGCPLSLAGTANQQARRSGTLDMPMLARSFGGLRLLPLHGHFGWRSAGVLRRAIGLGLDLYWRALAKPAHPRIYCSVCNPLMIVWAGRQDGSVGVETA